MQNQTASAAVGDRCIGLARDGWSCRERSECLCDARPIKRGSASIGPDDQQLPQYRKWRSRDFCAWRPQSGTITAKQLRLLSMGYSQFSLRPIDGAISIYVTSRGSTSHSLHDRCVSLSGPPCFRHHTGLDRFPEMVAGSNVGPADVICGVSG